MCKPSPQVAFSLSKDSYPIAHVGYLSASIRGFALATGKERNSFLETGSWTVSESR